MENSVRKVKYTLEEKSALSADETRREKSCPYHRMNMEKQRLFTKTAHAKLDHVQSVRKPFLEHPVSYEY